MKDDTSKSLELEVMAPSALEAITRGEIDVQISTAHKFPRSMEKFKKRALEMATLDEDTAASCIYSRPVGGGKFAEGLSVRTAEIVGAAYGNLRVGAMIVEQTERYVKVRGFAHDLESNFASSAEVIESTVKRDGSPYDERMRIVVAKAALAKARRDATFQVVPKALCKPIEEAARRVAIGDATTLNKRRDQVMQWVTKLGIDQARVFAALGIKGESEIGLDELARLTGIRTAIKDGDINIDESFPSIVPVAKVGTPAVDDATKKEKGPTPAEAQADAQSDAGERGVARELKELQTAVTKKLAEGNHGKGRLSQVLVDEGQLEKVVPFAEIPAAVLKAALDGWEHIVTKLKPT